MLEAHADNFGVRSNAQLHGAHAIGETEEITSSVIFRELSVRRKQIYRISTRESTVKHVKAFLVIFPLLRQKGELLFFGKRNLS